MPPSQHRIPELHVDHLIAAAQRQSTTRIHDTASFIRVKLACPSTPPPLLTLAQGNSVFGKQSRILLASTGTEAASLGDTLSLTFFSEARLLSLSNRLGNNRVDELVGRISSVIRGRMTKRPDPGQTSTLSSQHRDTAPEIFSDRVRACKYIECEYFGFHYSFLRSDFLVVYFERVHPVFPFLDQESFKDTALSEDILQTMARSKAWLCLYHSVLAAGSQFDHAGSFEPGTGTAWKLFSVALANFTDLLLQPDSLVSLQAMTAMAVYALNISCLAIERVITCEAARRAQNLATTPLTGRQAHMYQRTFWVLYAIEKMSSFHLGRSSVSRPERQQSFHND